jgi:hypothetical protein
MNDESGARDRGNVMMSATNNRRTVTELCPSGTSRRSVHGNFTLRGPVALS